MSRPCQASSERWRGFPADHPCVPLTVEVTLSFVRVHARLTFTDLDVLLRPLVLDSQQEPILPSDLSAHMPPPPSLASPPSGASVRSLHGCLSSSSPCGQVLSTCFLPVSRYGGV